MGGGFTLIISHLSSIKFAAYVIFELERRFFFLCSLFSLLSFEVNHNTHTIIHTQDSYLIGICILIQGSTGIGKKDRRSNFDVKEVENSISEGAEAIG